MKNISNLKALGFTRYEAACYMSLVSRHPLNGSQLSKISGIARSRIYDVLRNMAAKGYVIEADTGLYAPLPPEELIKRLKNNFDFNLNKFKQEVLRAYKEPVYEYIWTLTGYENIMAKAMEMIGNASFEIYVRLFPKTGSYLREHLKAAEKRGVNIRYIAMGDMPLEFDVQVSHPETDKLLDTIGGRSFDIITDRQESLVGIFEPGNEDNSPINWSRNKWFVTANRDSLRHDFYHCFLEKVYDENTPLTSEEQRIYKIIKQDG